MLDQLVPLVPPEAIALALVLALSFFVGLEREEHKQHDAVYAFGGVRTFPLIGLVSYGLALLSGAGSAPWLVGFAVIGSFMLLSYWHKLAAEPLASGTPRAAAGLTTEISGLVTYLLGGLVQREYFWIATTMAVLTVLLLELKLALEGLTKRIAPVEVSTFAKFLVLSVVVLPILPDRDFTLFHLDPFRTWLVVVAISGVSFASYVVQRLAGDRGVMLSAVLGGAYSSTVTTFVLSRQAKIAEQPHLFAGAILVASSVMYARLLLLIAFFAPALALHLAPGFGAVAGIGAVTGLLVSRRADGPETHPPGPPPERNPLELGGALGFALLFVTVQVLTRLAQAHLGQTGLYGLAAILGVTDVDPFILGLAQGGTAATPLHVAAIAIAIAAASNNVIKGIYALGVADRRTGRIALGLLLGLAGTSLIPLLWL